MERRVINALIVNDNDLECNCKDLTIDKINISTVSFTSADMEKFDMVIYKGNKGQKILKSACTNVGIIKK